MIEVPLSGRFCLEEVAARAYNVAACAAWGEFARLNDVMQREEPT